MRHAILALAFACLTPAHAQERTAYACIEQKATGFHPMENEKGFRNTNFQERRFTMIREGMRLEVKMDNDVTIYRVPPAVAVEASTFPMCRAFLLSYF